MDLARFVPSYLRFLRFDLFFSDKFYSWSPKLARFYRQLVRSYHRILRVSNSLFILHSNINTIPPIYKKHLIRSSYNIWNTTISTSKTNKHSSWFFFHNKSSSFSNTIVMPWLCSSSAGIIKNKGSTTEEMGDEEHEKMIPPGMIKLPTKEEITKIIRQVLLTPYIPSCWGSTNLNK